MTQRIVGLSGATIERAPAVCQSCIWWQTRAGKSTEKQRWVERAEDEWGTWGALYRDDDGRVLGFMQYGPGELFPRAAELPAGPPSPSSPSCFA